MRRVLMVPLLLAGLVGCTHQLEGPPADVDTLAKLDPPKQAPPAPQPPPGPLPSAGSFRAWIPETVQPNGDRVEGHWMLISTTPPALEIAEPPKPMPRVPHAHAPTAVERKRQDERERKQQEDGQASRLPPLAAPQPVAPALLSGGVSGVRPPQASSPPPMATPSLFGGQ